MKKAIVFILVAAIVLALTPAFIYADPKGPAEKATGEVLNEQENEWYISFNAQEAIGDKDAKGEIYHWSYIANREIYLDVKYVKVEGDQAWFAAVCTSDSRNSQNVGKWMFVKVKDNGSPGIYNDMIGWDWDSVSEAVAMGRVNSMANPGNWWTAQEGNLVVHTYE